MLRIGVSSRLNGFQERESVMNFGSLLHWAVVFLVVALIAGVLGFGGVAGTSMEAAKIVFWVAIVIAVLSFVFNGVRGRGL